MTNSTCVCPVLLLKTNPWVPFLCVPIIILTRMEDRRTLNLEFNILFFSKVSWVISEHPYWFLLRIMLTVSTETAISHVFLVAIAGKFKLNRLGPGATYETTYWRNLLQLYWRILAQGRFWTDVAALSPYSYDLRQIFPCTALMIG